MKHPVKKTNRVKISPESVLFVRLCSVELKLDIILSFLKNPQPGPVIDPAILQDAIRAHIKGDRGPIKQLEKLWESGLYVLPGVNNG